MSSKSYYNPDSGRWRFRSHFKRSTKLQLWKRAHGKCWYCGRSVGRNGFALDHQQPFSKGGLDTVKNLVVACHPCDRRKRDLTVAEFRALEQVPAFYGER
jgi:5-methylcytosine-specific restriction endonuclease McrA